MFYVASPERPTRDAMLHGPCSFLDAVDWAQARATATRKPLDVRHYASTALHASYGADGRNLPLREV